MLVVLLGNGWSLGPDGWISGGWNWSDLLVHVAIGSSIAAGNFPPEVPYFAGEPLTYHWFADFHGAIAATAAQVDLIPTYFLSSALMAGVLALAVWALACRLTGERRVATIATILVVAGGGLGWIRLIGDAAAGGNPLDLLGSTPYDNTWTTAGRTSGSRPSSGPASCPTGRRRSDCRVWSRSSCWWWRAWGAGHRGSSWPGSSRRCSPRSTSSRSQPPT